MNNEEKYCNKLIIFEIIITIIVLFMFLCIIFNLIKDSNKGKNNFQEPIPIQTILTSQSISEEPKTANLQKIEILTQNESIVIDSIVVEEVIIVNPYVEIIENLTEYEKGLIYKITFAEAGNQEEEGQRAVIEVILNRVLSDDFPDTVEGVLSQKNQFSTWAGRNKVRKIDQDRIINILELVAIEIPILPSLEYVFFARGKQTKYATDFIKIQDHWFGAAK